MTAFQTRSLAGLALMASVAVLGSGVLDLVQRVGSTWSGLPISINGYVGPDILIPRDLHAATSAVRFSDRVVEVDGIAVATGPAIRDRVASLPPGQRVLYRMTTPAGTQYTLELPARELSESYLRGVFLPLILVGVAFLAFSTVPVMARPELPLARAVFVLALGVVTFANFGLPDAFLTYSLSPLPFVFGVCFTAGLFHFALLFPAERWPYSSHPTATTALLYGSNGLFWAAYIAAVESAPGWIPALRAATVVLVVIAASGLIVNLVDAAGRSKVPRVRRLARVGLTAPLMWLAGVLAIFLTSYGVIEAYVPPIAQLIPAAMLVFCAFYGTVIDNAFEIDEVVRRLVAFFAVGLVAVSAYLVVFGLASLLFGTDGAFAGVTVAALVVVSLGPVVPVLHSRAEEFVEGALFPARRRARAAIELAAREIGTKRTPRAVGEFVCRTLGEAIPCTSVQILFGERGEPLRELAAPPGRVGLVLAPDDALYRALERGVSVSQEARLSRRRGTPQGALARSKELGLHLVVALPPGERTIGGIFLGEREDRQLFTRQDVALIEVLSRQAATVLENVVFWEEIEALRQRLEKENLQLREQVGVAMQVGDIVGTSAGVNELVQQLQQVAPTDASVLLMGETGTGKELALRALHGLSARASKPLVQVACAALPESLLESELFGHEKGAFSGAEQSRVGRIEAADGGTFFFDDVDTLPLGVQAKLLRALQEGEVQRLGSNQTKRVDVRIVASTNRDLLAEVRAGRFREDLYYRLAVVPLRIPPLRERREDIAALAEHFVALESVRLGRQVRGISVEMMEALEHYSWPGNIRELRNVIERSLVLATDDVLRLPAPLGEPLSPEEGRDGSGQEADELGSASLAELLRRYKTRLVKLALQRSGGNQRRAAQILGMHRPSLTRMIGDLGLRDEET